MLVDRQDNARGYMVFTQSVEQIVITKRQKSLFTGTVHVGQKHFVCKIGRGGIKHKSREGDGITPVGCWAMSYFLYRPDKFLKPKSGLPGFPILASDSWCDISDSRRYNQPINFSLPNTSEALWRKDNLYDVIIVLNHNSLPFISGKGSAVFIHLCHSATEFTQGCIALELADMINLLAISGPKTKVLIRS